MGPRAISKWLVVFACLAAGCASPTAPSTRTVPLTVRVFERGGDHPIQNATLLVNARQAGITNTDGEAVLTVPAGVELEVRAETPRYVAMSVSGTLVAAERWTFYLDRGALMTDFTRMEVYEGPDTLRRYHYALFWMADYHPGHPLGEYRTAERGQHFFGELPEMPIEKTKDLRGKRQMSFLNNHRGPYRLCVTRPAKKPGFFTSEWLPGETDRDEVESEARALLADPRDTITAVDLWSVREECFVGAFRAQNPA